MINIMKINKLKALVIICIILISNIDLTAQNYKLPDYTTFKLSNGLTIYLMEQHDVPIISVSAVVPAGAIYDGEKSGLASLTASALKLGTKNFTKRKIDEELDFIGANINTYASKEYAGISSKFAAKDLGKVLPIFKEILLQPVFNVEEFDKAKSRLLVRLEQQKESPKEVIGGFFDKLLYGNHVYSNLVEGNNETISKLTVDDLKFFYNTNYTPENSAISIVGDFSTKEMKKTIIALFSKWKKSNTLKENLASKPIKNPSESNVLLINKDDAKETTFLLERRVLVEIIQILFQLML